MKKLEKALTKMEKTNLQNLTTKELEAMLESLEKMKGKPAFTPAELHSLRLKKA